MLPKNVQTLLISGDNTDYILFKSAIHFAEKGLPVWYISPNRIENVPDNIETPDKEFLQMLTFLYLKDDSDLIHHLNTANTWHKSPQVIIISHFHQYIEVFNTSLIAFLWSTLLNSLSVLSRKHNTQSFSIVSCHFADKDITKCANLYFNHSITFKEENTDKDTIANEIIQIFNK